MLRRTSLITFVAGVVGLIAIACAVRLSLDPNHYHFYEAADRAAWVYRPGLVALVCLMILVEAALVWGVFVSPQPIFWLRCVIGLGLLGPWALLSTSVFLHAPGYVLFHHLWVWSLVMVLALAALVSAGRHAWWRLHRRKSGAKRQTP